MNKHERQVQRRAKRLRRHRGVDPDSERSDDARPVVGNALDRFVLKHGRPLMASFPVGKDDHVTVHVSRQYIELHQRGAHIFIPRPQLIRLLKWLIPKTKLMSGSFFPPEAAERYYRKDAKLMKQLKRERKLHYSGSKPRRRDR